MLYCSSVHVLASRASDGITSIEELHTSAKCLEAFHNGQDCIHCKINGAATTATLIGGQYTATIAGL